MYEQGDLNYDQTTTDIETETRAKTLNLSSVEVLTF